jgi:hypothetical protein
MLECVHETRFFALGDVGDLHGGNYASNSHRPLDMGTISIIAV